MKDVLTALFSARQDTKVNELSAESREECPPVVDDIVACTGKLPLYADFLRSNLNSSEAIALDKWLQGGFQYLSQRRRSNFKEVFNRFPKLEFILFGDEYLRPVSGVIISSKDQSGREYPFCIFKVLGATVETSQIPCMPGMLKKFQYLAMELCQENWGTVDKNILYKRINALPINELQAGPDYLRRQSRCELEVLSSRSFWDAILPASSLEERMEFIKIFNKQIRSILALRPDSRKWGIEINILNSNKREMVQQFFITLIVKLLAGKSWNGQSWLSELKEGKSSLTIFFRPVATEDFLTLVDYEAERNNIYVINDLIEQCNIKSTNQSNTSEHSTCMAELMNDWVSLYKNEQHQYGSN